MAEVKGCNRLPPVLQPGAQRPLMAPRRSAVPEVFMLIQPGAAVLFRWFPAKGWS